MVEKLDIRNLIRAARKAKQSKLVKRYGKTFIITVEKV